MQEEYKDEKRIEEETVLHDLWPEAVYCEAVGDYTLPDYQPEIRRLLHIRTEVLPAGRYMAEGKAEFAGNLTHVLLYADAEGKLACVTLDADYDFSIPLPEGEEIDVSVYTTAEPTVCRLAGPRKLSLRTRLKNELHLYRESPVSPVVRGMGSEKDTASLERVNLHMETMSVAHGSCGAFTLTATVPVDGPCQGQEVIWAGGHLQVSECRMQEGGCLCRGHAWVRALLSGAEGQAPYAVREKIAFEQMVPLTGKGERAACMASGRLLLTEATLLPGGEEGGSSLTFTARAELDATAIRPRTACPTGDLYSTDYQMTCSYRTAKATRACGMGGGFYTVSASRPRTECEAEQAVALVDTDGRVELQSVQVERGRAVVSGRVLATVIFAGAEEGRAPLGTAEVPIPFRIETDLHPTPGSTPRFDCRGELIAARARLEPSAVTVDAELALTLSAFEEENCRILKEAEPDGSLPVEHRGNRLYVVYPQEEDTLFSLGAHYHKSRASLAEQNGLGEGVLSTSHLTASLDGVHHLLVED